MQRTPSWLLIVPVGLVLSLLSSAKAGRARAVYSEIMGCESGCDVAAAGWPIPYLVDYPGISVVGVANLSGAMLGEDKFHTAPFTMTLLFWVAASAAAWFLWRRIMRKSK
jgi:hypothetical protein